MSTIDAAIRLCRAVEAVCPRFGCHVGLTGGCLYKDGVRKDIDIILYRIRQVEEIDRNGLNDALGRIGLSLEKEYGWMQKMTWEGTVVDVFFPEEIDATDGPYAAQEILPADSLIEAAKQDEAMRLLDASF